MYSKLSLLSMFVSRLKTALFKKAWHGGSRTFQPQKSMDYIFEFITIIIIIIIIVVVIIIINNYYCLSYRLFNLSVYD